MEPDLSYFDKLDTPLRDIALALHHLVRQQAPHLGMKVRWGYPSFVGHKDVISIAQFARGEKAHLNMQLHFGAALGNEHGLIEGHGKNMRHIKFTTLSEIGRDGVTKAIRDAAEYDEVFGR